MAEVVFGRPFKGYQDSVSRQEVPPDKTTSEGGDASNWQLLPGKSGRWKRRAGILQDFNGLTEGIVTYNAAWPAVGYKFKGIQISEHRSAALGLGFPVTWCAMIADEEKTGGSQAQLVYRDTAAAVIRRPAYDAANAAFPMSGTIVWPWIAGPRARSDVSRAKMMAGARNYLDTTARIYSSAYGSDSQHEGIPNSWNKRYPNSSIVAERVERVQPAGMLPPMWIPRVTVAGATTVGNESWHDSDMFYLSVLFIYEDGSWGPPCMPRAPNNLLPVGATNINTVSPVAMGGYGLVRLAATAAAPAIAYPYIVIDDIPIGPGGLVVGRVIVRSPKVAGPAAGVAATVMPDPSDLRVMKIIMDNTTTSCVIADGTDAGLLVDTKVRFDHVMAPPARYLGQMDGRVVSSYVRDNPYGILISFRNNTNACDPGGAAAPFTSIHNTPDDAIGLGAGDREAYVDIQAGGGLHIDLYVTAIAGTITNKRMYGLVGVTLQQLVDQINSQRQVFGADSNVDYRWHAQLCPGVNGDQPATNLDATNTVAFGDRAWNTTAGVLDGGAAMAAGVGLNPMRSCCVAWPAVLLQTLTARPESYPGLSYFTSANPGDARNAANHYLLGDPQLGSFNVRTPPPNFGDCAGPWLPIEQGAICPYTRGVARCYNVTQQFTGIDDDYRVVPIDSERGVISPACAAGHGFAVVLTTQGLYAYDETVSEQGRRAVNLSAALYNPSDGKGILAYEISQCIAATAKNDSTGYFSIAIGDNKIRISFRSSAAVTRPDVWMDLDFSPGIDQHGISALVDPDTNEAWGWSCPLKPADLINEDGVNRTIAPSAMGVVRNTDGTISWFGTRDKHIAGTTDCRMEKLDTGLTDNGSVLAGSTLYTPSLYNEKRWIQCHRVFTRYKKNGAGLTVALARSMDAHANPTYFNTAKALATTGTKLYGRYWWPLPNAKRTPTDTVEIRWQDDGTGPQPEIWDGALEYEPIDLGI